MKCPELYTSVQQNIRRPIVDDEDIVRGEYHLLIESQSFCECYKENCAYWNTEKHRCGKVE